MKDWWHYHDGVYVVRAPELARVKVGVTLEFTRRLSQLRVSSPTPIEVVHIVKGGKRELERAIHRFLYPCSLYGEWFFEEGRAAEFIRRLLRHGKVTTVDLAIAEMHATRERETATLWTERLQTWDSLQARREHLGIRKLKEDSPYDCEDAPLPLMTGRKKELGVYAR